MKTVDLSFINKGSKRQRGWDYFFGPSKFGRRQRHRSAQMKALQKGRFTGKGARFGL